MVIPDNLARSSLSKCHISYVINSPMIIQNINLYNNNNNTQLKTPLKITEDIIDYRYRRDIIKDRHPYGSSHP